MRRKKPLYSLSMCPVVINFPFSYLYAPPFFKSTKQVFHLSLFNCPALFPLILLHLSIKALSLCQQYPLPFIYYIFLLPLWGFIAAVSLKSYALLFQVSVIWETFCTFVHSKKDYNWRQNLFSSSHLPLEKLLTFTLSNHLPFNSFWETLSEWKGKKFGPPNFVSRLKVFTEVFNLEGFAHSLEISTLVLWIPSRRKVEVVSSRGNFEKALSAIKSLSERCLIQKRRGKEGRIGALARTPPSSPFLSPVKHSCLFQTF